MSRKTAVALFAILFAVGGLKSVARAGTVTVVSGVDNGSSRDANVSFSGSSAEGPLASLDFSAARTGGAAYIVTKNKAWTAPGSSDGAWISSVATAYTTTGSALFAVPFTMTDTGSPISLDVSFLVDNGLGSSTQAGLYIDGNAVSGSSWIPSVKGDFFKVTQTFYSSDVSSLFGSGADHDLYFYVLNKVASGNPNPSGLTFSATFTPASIESVPLPHAVWMGLVLLAAVGVVSWRRRRFFHSAE